MNIKTLLEEIDRILDHDPDAEIMDASREFCSYRGYYEHLAMARSDGRKMALVAFYNALSSQLGQTFCGYKGGEYVLDDSKMLFVADYGRTGEWVVGIEKNIDGEYELRTAETDWNGF